jgi:hypothetical protein
LEEKNSKKIDVNEPFMQEHFEYVDFLYKKWFWDFDIFVKFTPFVEFVYRNVPDKFNVTFK